MEVAILRALGDLGATPDLPHIKNSKPVRLIEDAHGFGYRYTWEALCDLARPWRAPVSLVDFHGNYGGGYFPASPARHTESRLSRAGVLAVAAEAGELGPLPISLINGTMYQGGDRPPFDPLGVIDALLAIGADPTLSDGSILAIVGPPAFPGRCEVHGDVEALLTGHRVDMTLRGRLEVEERREGTVIVVTHFPPERWAEGLEAVLRVHCSPASWEAWSEGDWMDEGFDRLPIVEVRSTSSGAVDHSNERAEIVVENGADVNTVLARLRGDDQEFVNEGDERDFGVRHDLDADIGMPLAQLLRDWIASHPSAVEVNRSLSELRHAVSPPNRRPAPGH